MAYSDLRFPRRSKYGVKNILNFGFFIFSVMNKICVVLFIITDISTLKKLDKNILVSNVSVVLAITLTAFTSLFNIS